MKQGVNDKDLKKIFGVEHEITYNDKIGLIESAGRFSRMFLNLSILISRRLVRHSKDGIAVETDQQA